jgi:hypothetical protein
MALHYQTEYRLGNRGRICRSYSGFQALIAIGFDLIFGLLFELISLVFTQAFRLSILAVQLVFRLLRIYWKILVAAMTLIVYILTLPFAWLHNAVDRFRSPDHPEHAPSPSSILKPDWALSREV